MKNPGFVQSGNVNTFKKLLTDYNIDFEFRADAYIKYSKRRGGKQKDHTVKNNLMCRDNQQIVYLSETYQGRVHDKKIADQEACQFPANSRLRLDLGYLGYHPKGVLTLLPIKKPYQDKLTEQQKKFNRAANRQWVSRYRVVVEHTISGVKRCHIVKERCCSFAARFRNQVMLTCTALHNFRVSSPQRGYG